MSDESLRAGLHEALVTRRLKRLLAELSASGLEPDIDELRDSEAADRVSRHLAIWLARFIEKEPEGERAAGACRVAGEVLRLLAALAPRAMELEDELLDEPGRVLRAVLRRRPDGEIAALERPLTPLLDTTLLTNAPGEPAVGHELKAEVDSADAIDIVIAFIRWSGLRPLAPALRRHAGDGKSIRVLTTTYTQSTERRALEELQRLGAQVKVSYDTSSTRLHAKAWLFHRPGGYSTAYIGSSNLTYSAQATGLEWNVRVSEARNPDVIAKMAAVFDSYWERPEFAPFDAEDFQRRTSAAENGPGVTLSPVEVVLRPFQEQLLERIAVARRQGHHRNLLVSATRTGKTVMAAVDYARLRMELPRARLLFVAHREEIIDQSLATFRHTLREASFGEKWVGGARAAAFDHVFASIHSLSSVGLQHLAPDHFDVVIIDEFHHAAAPSYEALLDKLRPRELLGLTATPERSDGLDILRHFDGRIAAELRLWDAIDQQHLAPFAYFGVHDGADLSQVPWRRGSGYDATELTRVLTADHARARLVLRELQDKVADASRIRGLGFCVTVEHARFMADRFTEAGLPSRAVWGDSREDERRTALRDLADGSVRMLFTVDLYNEGVDAPAVDTVLLLRPTESPTLFLQQLGRGLRKARGKTVCTVLDFVGRHRQEFRFDRRLRALLGGSRADVTKQVEAGFPFLPAGCHMELDRVAQEVVLKSLRDALPSEWRAKCSELRSLGDVSLSRFLEETGLELEDVYAGLHSWSEMRRAAGLPAAPAGAEEESLLRAVGRWLHVDDATRIAAYRSYLETPEPPRMDTLDESGRRLLRMLVSSVTSFGPSRAFEDALRQLWGHPQVRSELLELLGCLERRADRLDAPLGIDAPVPLRVHARYTRLEILAAFGVGSGAQPSRWQTGCWWERESATDLFAFTLDKSSGGFSPTTRYRDYALSPELIHWESQSTTSVASETGQRYIHHATRGTSVVLFARLRADDRAFWCLGPATYVRHEGDRPIAFVWRLQHRLPPDLYTAFAAAVA